MSMTNDQAAMIAAAISKHGFSAQAVINEAKTLSAALNNGLNPQVHWDDDEDDDKDTG